MSRLKVVLDTNVLISAALKPQGWEAMVVHLVAFRAVEAFVSEAILAEYREVFRRPKFSRLDPQEVSHLLSLFQAEATLVEPAGELTISKHPSDNRFYECADAAEADYIVTGNTRHFQKPYKNIKIITGRQIVELVTGGQL